MRRRTIRICLLILLQLTGSLQVSGWSAQSDGYGPEVRSFLDLVKETAKDYVPELCVVAASELDQLIGDGTSVIKGVKRGGIIGNKWRYLGSVHRGEPFYIFERLTVK